MDNAETRHPEEKGGGPHRHREFCVYVFLSCGFRGGSAVKKVSTCQGRRHKFDP